MLYELACAETIKGGILTTRQVSYRPATCWKGFMYMLLSLELRNAGLHHDTELTK